MLTRSSGLLKFSSTYTVAKNHFHVTPCVSEIQKMTRLRVVDNSEIGKRAMAEGKPPKCIHVYNKTGIGMIGKPYQVTAALCQQQY